MLDQFFVYHPAPWEDRNWASLSGLPLQDVWFPAADGTKLFGWYVEAAPGAPVLLWCHGNAGNIIHRLDNLAALYRIGLSVLLFDYRGYGRSQGAPTEEGLYQDALGGHAYLLDARRVRAERLVLFGRSLGAAVAGDLATRRRAAGLILESCFPSVAAVARTVSFGLPFHWLLSARYDLLERLPKISMPILVIHGERDTIIPIELGRQVFEAALQPKSFYSVPGADHNDLPFVGGRPYFQRLKRFAEEVAR